MPILRNHTNRALSEVVDSLVQVVLVIFKQCHRELSISGVLSPQQHHELYMKAVMGRGSETRESLAGLECG